MKIPTWHCTKIGNRKWQVCRFYLDGTIYIKVLCRLLKKENVLQFSGLMTPTYWPRHHMPPKKIQQEILDTDAILDLTFLVPTLQKIKFHV